MIFGNRKVAVTLVKTKKNTDDPTSEPMPLQQIGDTIVTTAEGVGSVVITVAATLTVLRIAEAGIKYILR